MIVLLQIEPNAVHFWDSKPSVELLAGPRFFSAGLHLNPGDIVGFVGTLSWPTIGGLKPEVDLVAIECISCQQGAFSIKAPEESRAFHWHLADFATRALQGTADFLLPHFIRFNVSQLTTSN